MATPNRRSVRLDVELQTVGEESLRRAGAALRTLAEQGEEAAPDLARLATEFDRLAERAKSLGNLSAASAAVDRLSEEQREAAGAAALAGEAYTRQAAAVAALRMREQELAEAVRQGREAKVAAENSVRELTRSTDAAGKQALGYRSRQTELNEALSQSNATIVENRNALERLQPELRQAATEEARLATALQRAEDAARSRATALLTGERALQAAGAAAFAAGVATTELAAAEGDLVTATRAAAVEANRLAEAREVGEAAMRKLTAPERPPEAEQEQLTASLREAEAAERRYVVAIEAAAAAGTDDVAALRARRTAAEALINTERELDLAQRELAQSRSAARAGLVADAQALVQAARAADEKAAATRRLVTEAKQAGAALQQAFGATGVRSIDAIEREIAETAAAMFTLERAARSGAVGVDDLNRAAAAAAVKVNRLQQEIQQVQTLPGAFERINTSFNSLLTRFGALSAAIATVGVAVQPILQATIALDQMRRVLTTVTGSAESAERQIEFLRRTAQQSGQEFGGLGQSYAKFAASALQSGLSLETVQEVFKSVALAAGNLGLSTDQSRRALEALSQIASKGTVGMEELRQQLGDALPGVLPLLAKELGLTQQELAKVVESGQLLANEAIPAIGRALTAFQPQNGVINGLVASWNRFVNVVKQAGTTIVEGPAGAAVGAGLEKLGALIARLGQTAVITSEAVGLSARALGTLAGEAALAAKGQGDLDRLLAQLSSNLEEARGKVNSYNETAFNLSTTNKELAEALKGVGLSLAKLALEQQKQIDQAEIGSAATRKYAEAAEKYAEAIGELNAIEEDQERAAERSVEATERVAVARRRSSEAAELEAEQLRIAKIALIEETQRRGESVDSIKALVEKRNDQIVKAEAAAQKEAALAEKARVVAANTRAAAEAIGDQSKQLDALVAAVDRAAVEYERLRILNNEGRASSDKLKDADEALTRAKKALKNAIDDLNTALQRSISVLESENEVKTAGLRLELERAKTAEVLAKARGDEVAATQANIAVKQIEASIARAENNLTLQTIRLKLDELDTRERQLRASRQLTPALEAEIATARRLLIAQTLETAAKEEANKRTVISTENVKKDTEARSRHGAVLDTNRSYLERHSTAQRTDNEEARASAELNQAVVRAIEAKNEALTQMLRTYERATAAERAATEAAREYNRARGETSGITGFGDSQTRERERTFEDGKIDSIGDLIRRTPDGGITRTVDTGQATNRPSSGNWTYTLDPAQIVVPGRDAKNNPVPGGWMRVPVTNSGLTGGRPTVPTLGTGGGGGGGLLLTPAPRATPSSASRTVNVNLTLAGETASLTGLAEREADQLLTLLERAQSARS
jgi:tape measure domain-containing protein